MCWPIRHGEKIPSFSNSCCIFLTRKVDSAQLIFLAAGAIALDLQRKMVARRV